MLENLLTISFSLAMATSVCSGIFFWRAFTGYQLEDRCVATFVLSTCVLAIFALLQTVPIFWQAEDGSWAEWLFGTIYLFAAAVFIYGSFKESWMCYVQRICAE